MSVGDSGQLDERERETLDGIVEREVDGSRDADRASSMISRHCFSSYPPVAPLSMTQLFIALVIIIVLLASVLVWRAASVLLILIIVTSRIQVKFKPLATTTTS